MRDSIIKHMINEQITESMDKVEKLRRHYEPESEDPMTDLVTELVFSTVESVVRDTIESIRSTQLLSDEELMTLADQFYDLEDIMTLPEPVKQYENLRNL